jgi:hypothetical protein
MKLIYTKDENNKEILQDESGLHQVMMEWEKPYMELCIEKLNPFGSVLEIGFGLGYSATKLCEFDAVTEYTVIECSPVVWSKFEEWKREELIKRPELKINLIKGRWQDVLSIADIYDTIFFDDYINEVKTEENIGRFVRFLVGLIESHVKVGTRISLYSTHPFNNPNLDSVKCIKVENIEHQIDIPRHCNYAKGDKMYIPIIEIVNDNFNEIQKLNDNRRMKHMVEQKTKIENIKNYYNKYTVRHSNLIVIDNFYNNAMEFRKQILNLEFKLPGIYGGIRTNSNTNDGIKYLIEKYIEPFAGKITKWNTSLDKDNLNGCFEIITANDRLNINTKKSEYNWGGILLLSTPSDLDTGLTIYRFKDGTRYKGEVELRGNIEFIENYKISRTSWERVDSVGYLFNRLILFNLDYFSGFQNNFGINKETGNLIQMFYFSTENRI